MYKVKMDGQTLWYPGDKEAVLLNPIVKLQTGYAGTFEATIPPTNPLYDSVRNRNSMVSVYKDKKEIFYGEVRKIPKIDRYKNKEIYCAGAMSFLADSIQPQAEYHDLSPYQMLEKFLEEHNNQVEERKRIYIGQVTVTDPNDSLYRYTNYENTLKAIREKLVEKLGGYLRLRHEKDNLYLDWLMIEDYGAVCSQPIEFGLNMLDYSESRTAENVATALIPLGARLEGESEIEALEKYTDITSVNDGINYVYSPEAVKNFGWIWATETWQDVTEPSNLKRKAEEWLESNQFEELTLSLTAVDLSDLTADYDSFDCGDRILCRASAFGMKKVLPVMQMEIPLQKPDDRKLSLGESVKQTYTSSVSKTYTKIASDAEKRRKEQNEKVKAAIDNLTAKMTGSSGGYRLEEYDDDGKWVRSLYMDSPDKETAKKVLQINMNGIGGSKNGYEGPYTVGMTLDGEINGKMITANSIQAEALDVNYRETVETTISEKANNAEKEAKSYVDEIKSSLDKELEDVNTGMDALDEQLNYITSDGIITEAEKASINKILQSVQKEKEESDKKYEELYKNAYLTDVGKKALKDKYDTVYGSSNDSKYNVLIAKITAVTKCETANDVNTAMKAYKTAYDEYSTAVAEYKNTINSTMEIISREYTIEQATKAQQDAERTAQKYTDDTVRVAKQTIETSMGTLENRINMNVDSTKEIAARKNYIQYGEPDNIELQKFTRTIDNSCGSITQAKFLNVSCLKMNFTASGTMTVKQNIGSVEAGTYMITVMAAYPDGARPVKITYGMSGATTGEMFSTYEAEKYNTFRKTIKTTDTGEQTVSITIQGEKGDVCYLTSIRCLRDYQELIDDVNANITVEVGKVSQKVSENYEDANWNYCTSDFSNLDGWQTSGTVTSVTVDGVKCARLARTTSATNLRWPMEDFTRGHKLTVKFKAKCASGQESKAQIRVSIDGVKQETQAGEITSVWHQFEFENDDIEPSGIPVIFYNMVDNTTVFICDVKIIGEYTEYSQAMIETLKNSVNIEVERAQGAEEKLSASIKVNEDAITERVSKGEFGSYVSQYYDRVITAFNGSSKYVQITAGEISIYDAGIESSKKRSAFDENGNHFWRSGYYVGKIGTNVWQKDETHKGLVFDLESQGKYMAWAQKKSSSDKNYATILCYSRANSLYNEEGLHFGCNTYMHGWYLYNPDIRSASYDGYTGATGSVSIVTKIVSNGDGSITWYTGSFNVRSGGVTAIPS